MELNNKIIILILILGIIILINNISQPVKGVQKSEPVSNFSSYINKILSSAFSFVNN
jgi:hypothetical protein